LAGCEKLVQLCECWCSAWRRSMITRRKLRNLRETRMCGTWQWGSSCHAIPREAEGSKALGAWRHVSPARRFGSEFHLAVLEQRQAITQWQQLWLVDVHDLQGYYDTSKVGLLVFLELWLRTYPL